MMVEKTETCSDKKEYYIKVVALYGTYSDSDTMGLIPARAMVFLECRSIVYLYTFHRSSHGWQTSGYRISQSYPRNRPWRPIGL
jgi:hypothetical protein